MIKDFFCTDGNQVIQYGPGGGASFATVRGASSGNAPWKDSGTGEGFQCRRTGSDYILCRYHFPFDLTKLPKGSKLTSCVFWFYVGANPGGGSGNASLVPSSIADPNAPVAADYSRISFVS